MSNKNHWNTMEVKGGMLLNSLKYERYQTDESPQGRRVEFAFDENGRAYEVEYAKKYLKLGQVLTVKEIYVDRSSSQVEFEEYPGKYFNSVLFADCIENEGAK